MAKLVKPVALDATAFQDINYQGRYRFPFERLDPTPGGSNLGCIEWHVELMPDSRRRQGRRRVVSAFVWASQTRDTRYAGKLFTLPAHCDGILVLAVGLGLSYLGGVWFMGFCPIHKQLAMSSYPPDGSSALVVDFWLSTAGHIYYE